MNEFSILFKREWKEKLNSFKKNKFSISNFIFSVLLVGIVLSAVVFVLFYVFDIYLDLKIGYNADIVAREKELLTLIYFITFAILSLTATYKINKKIANDKNMNALLVLPIKSQSIFLVKFASIFLETLLSAVVSLVWVTVILCISCSLSVGLIFSSLYIALIIAINAVFIGSLLALPFHFLSKLLAKHFVGYTIFYVCVVGGLFFLYSGFLSVLKDLLESGQIQFLLSQDFVLSVHNFTNAVFPFNIFADLVLGIDVWKNLGISFAVLIVVSVLAFLIIKYIFGLVSQNRLATITQFKRKFVTYKPKTTTSSLMAREFIHILRTPAYSLQYFAIAITLPLLVYITATLLVSLVENLIFVKCDFVIGLFCVVMFALLTNTFCSSNISREGKYFKALKALPINSNQVLGSKVIFSLIVSFVAILLSCIVLMIVGIFNFWQMLVVFIVCSLFSVAEVLFATRMDLNKPDFDKKSGSATNILLFGGIIISLVLGGVSLFTSLYCSIKYTAGMGDLIVILISSIFAIITLILSLLYYKKGINKKYEEVSGYEI
ncbi:MAG: hypothetical protein IJZ29_04230 [Clostridia bacterium]|nr:hypothetical protein [Clostridia bacterium]